MQSVCQQHLFNSFVFCTESRMKDKRQTQASLSLNQNSEGTRWLLHANMFSHSHQVKVAHAPQFRWPKFNDKRSQHHFFTSTLVRLRDSWLTESTEDKQQTFKADHLIFFWEAFQQFAVSDLPQPPQESCLASVLLDLLLTEAGSLCRRHLWGASSRWARHAHGHIPT